MREDWCYSLRTCVNIAQVLESDTFLETRQNLESTSVGMEWIGPIEREIEQGQGAEDAVELQLAADQDLGRNSKIEDFAHEHRVRRSILSPRTARSAR